MVSDLSHFSQKAKRKVQCTLCPHLCTLHEGNTGICGVRRNLGGRIRGKNFGIISSLAIDPIEKKPLYHYYPGKNILSVGSWGCNLKCNFCQNWQISQTCNGENINGQKISSDELVVKAQEIDNNIGIAYTYNEPTVWYEFMFDIALKNKKAGFKNIMISNGYINEEPLCLLLDYIDAFNIDLKAFSNSFYKEMTGGELAPVLDTIKRIKKHNKHLEITNLIIPGKNDNADEFAQMVNWIANETGCDTVLHLSRYFPRYKQSLPSTEINKLLELKDIAETKLKYVYIGNVVGENITKCGKCGKELIKRSGYGVSFLANYKNGECANCGNFIAYS